MTRCARLAPSPTGGQHLGNARTYLIAWLSARSQGAKVILRIEDIDSPRVKPESVPLIAEDLAWLGLDWDDGPILQTPRLPMYEAALRSLQEREMVYPCTCTRTDIANAASAPHMEYEAPAYPGTCASRSVADAATIDRSFAWRFRVRESMDFVDGFLGEVSIDPRVIGGDFVVWKAVDTPAYQLAVVVDDAAMNVTEVVRGDDLLPSTPRQLLLYRALKLLSPPKYYHVPLVRGPDGKRLAKRHGEARLAPLRHAGVKVETIVGFLAWTCGWIDLCEPITARELLPIFKWDSIPKRDLVLTPELLQAVS